MKGGHHKEDPGKNKEANKGKHDKEDLHDKTGKNDNEGKREKNDEHSKGEKHEKEEKHDKKEDHGKDGKHDKKGKHDHKNENDKHDHLSPKQLDLCKKCKTMLSIVRNQDKDKLYTYVSSDDKHETVNLRQQMANCLNTTKFNKNSADPGPFKANSIGHCKINLCYTLAIECARNMNKNGLSKIAVMSFASPHSPGGPFEKGILTQETSIISQTLLIGSLLTQSARPFYIEKQPHKDKDKGKNKNKGNADSLNNGLIYSPMVPVITDSEGKLCKTKDVFYIDVISVSPVILPKKNHHKDDKHGHNHGHNDSKHQGGGQSLQAKVVPIMEKKIRDTIFVAASVKAEGLILGAFGCGLGGNDPRVISKIFHKILIEDGYAGHFKQIDFAILGKEATNAFQECFKDHLQKDVSTAQPSSIEPDEEESIQQSSSSTDSSDESSNSDNDHDGAKKDTKSKKTDDDKKDTKNTKADDTKKDDDNDDDSDENDDEPDIC